MIGLHINFKFSGLEEKFIIIIINLCERMCASYVTDFIITQIGGEFHSPTTTSKSTVTKLHTCISKTPLASSKVGQNGLFMLREGLPVEIHYHIHTKS